MKAFLALILILTGLCAAVNANTYQLISGDFTWSQAKSDAGNKGGHLATITSADEWTEIKNQLGDLSGKVIAIGGSDSVVEGDWKWVTGEDWDWTHWCDGEPNNQFGVEDVLSIDGNWSRCPDGRWSDSPDSGGISTYYYYLLEIEPESGNNGNLSPLSVANAKGPQPVSALDPIAPAGNFNFSALDFSELPALPAQYFMRSYNSFETNSVVLGCGWMHNYQARIESSTGGVVRINGDGKQETYLLTNGIYHIAGSEYNGDLLTNSMGWMYVDLKNLAFSYDNSGRLVSINDSNSNCIHLTYSSSALTNVLNTLNRQMLFSYSPTGLLTNVSDWAGRSVAYNYTNRNGQVLLKSARDVRGILTTYQYDTNGFLSAITDPRGFVIVSNVYDGLGRVVTQYDALGKRSDISY